MAFEIGHIYEFEIDRYGTFKDKMGLEHECALLKWEGEGLLSLKVLTWQRKEYWHYGTIRCKVKSVLNSGLLKLEPYDNRHPYLNLNEEYDFEVKEIFKFQRFDNNGRNQVIELIRLVDSHGLFHQTKLLPWQKGRVDAGDIIRCRVREMKRNVVLEQVIPSIDPYFYEVEAISTDSRFIELFQIIVAEDVKMKNQYSSKSAFWVMTFCDKLESRIRNYKYGEDFKKLEFLVDSLLELEKFILEKELLSALQGRKKERTVTKIQIVIEEMTIKQRALQIIDEGQIDSYLETVPLDLSILNQLILYSSFNSIHYIRISEIFEKLEDISKSRIDLKKIARSILVSGNLEVEDYSESLFNNGKIIYKNEEALRNLIFWHYILYLISRFLDERENELLNLGRLLKWLAVNEEDISIRKEYLVSSFHLFVGYNNLNLKISREVNTYIPSVSSSIDFKEKLDETLNKVINFNKEYGFTEVQVFQRVSNGFLVRFENLKGLLPTHFITDKSLKFHQFDEIDWIATVSIELISKEFGFFIARQIPKDDINHRSESNFSFSDTSLNAVISGKVKSVLEYGVFISTYLGEGLLHKSNISDDYWDLLTLEERFVVGSEIKVRVLRKRDDNTVEFSFKDHLGTNEEDYYYEQLYGEHENVSYGSGVENSSREKTKEWEKGSIFEKYAFMTTEGQSKIDYLEFAQYFYSNSNFSRSEGFPKISYS